MHGRVYFRCLRITAAQVSQAARAARGRSVP